MKEIREMLIKLGFTLTKSGPNIWDEQLYEWKDEPERGPRSYVWVGSGSNCHFKVVTECRAMETGDPGFAKHTVFCGTTDDVSEFMLMLKITHVLSLMGK